MREIKVRTSQTPRPLPPGRWAMTQRWNDVLFAHWAVSVSSVAPLLPDGLQVDTHQGTAWLGVVPFWMDRIKLRGLPAIPGMRSFPELNLRTYVRDHAGARGVYFLSLEGSNLLGVAAARTFYHLPYYWAQMEFKQRSEREFSFYSRRRFAGDSVIFSARYRGLGPTRKLAEMRSGSLEYFLTERYCLFTQSRAGHLVRANIHHVQWPLEDAEAEIDRNDLAMAAGIPVPEQEPVLHYSRRLAVYLWPAELAELARRRQPIPVQALPSV